MLGRAIALASGFCSLTLLAHAAEPTLLHVNTFPTARSLPFYVALDRGFFARHGLKVELEFTESSERQREGLAGGTVDIVHSAVDNAVAMIDVAKVDIVIVSGGDSGTNEFYVQDTIKDFSDIRGKAIVVDATNTAYALQARKILGQHGLRDGTDYSLNPVGNGQRRLKALLDDKNNAGAILNLPYSLQAAAKGMRSLGRTTDMLGPYQAGGAFVRRAWARENAATLENYPRGLRQRPAALVARSEQPRRGCGHSGRQAEAAAGCRRKESRADGGARLRLCPRCRLRHGRFQERAGAARRSRRRRAVRSATLHRSQLL